MQYANRVKFEFEFEDCSNDAHYQRIAIRNFQSQHIKKQRAASCTTQKAQRIVSTCLILSFLKCPNINIFCYSQIHGACRGEGAVSAWRLLPLNSIPILDHLRFLRR